MTSASRSAVIAFAMACALARLAVAGPTTKVMVESAPPGAKVYLNEIEDGVKCEPTPCSIDAPIGDSVAIVVLDGYVSEYVPLELKKRGAKEARKVTLRRAIATLVVDGARGVSIQVKDADGAEKATANVPHTFELAAGGYQIVFSQNGKEYDQQYIDLDANQELTITAKPPTVATKDPGDGDPDGGKLTKQTEPSTPPAPRDRVVALGALFDVGFRKFSFQNAQTMNVRDLPFMTELLAGGTLELYPGALVRPLKTLSLFARVEASIDDPNVTGSGIVGPLHSQWRGYEVSVRYKWLIADVAAIEASAGYVRDQLQFVGSSSDVGMAPNADYQSVRIGVKGAYLTGRFEAYATAEGRIGLSGGELATRFDGGASFDGVHVALGGAVRFGPMIARIDAGLTQYGWTFKYTSQSSIYQADGGTDLIMAITSVLSYAY
jgi:hypothetical protein